MDTRMYTRLQLSYPGANFTAHNIPLFYIFTRHNDNLQTETLMTSEYLNELE